MQLSATSQAGTRVSRDLLGLFFHPLGRTCTQVQVQMKNISKYKFWKEMNAPEGKFENAFLMGRSPQGVMNGGHQGKELVASPLLAGSFVFRAMLQKQTCSLYSEPPVVSPQ